MSLSSRIALSPPLLGPALLGTPLAAAVLLIGRIGFMGPIGGGYGWRPLSSFRAFAFAARLRKGSSPHPLPYGPPLLRGPRGARAPC